MKPAPLFLLAALLAAGCIESPATPTPNTYQGGLVCRPEPQVHETVASGTHLPNGADSRLYFEFRWSWEPSELQQVDIKVEWQAAFPTTTNLRVETDFFSTREFHEEPSAEGPSPLALSIAPRNSTIDRSKIYLGPVQNATGPTGFSIARPDQDVTVTIQETYRCSEGRHPRGMTPTPTDDPSVRQRVRVQPGTP